jgi:uncharacterized cysteine cluster protein YcgN (CxxCxxCC family)
MNGGSCRCKKYKKRMVVGVDVKNIKKRMVVDVDVKNIKNEWW